MGQDDTSLHSSSIIELFRRNLADVSAFYHQVTSNIIGVQFSFWAAEIKIHVYCEL
jgi:hypothetical protein